MKTKLLEIERLRGLAALMIVFAHVPFLNPFANRPLLEDPWAGVDLFFVISGFVIAGTLLRSLPEAPAGAPLEERFRAAVPALKEFFTRRVFRILPLALTWLFVPLVLAVAFNRTGVFSSPAGLVREILAVLTLSYNYAVAYGLDHKLGVYWSLSVEEHFYLLLPFLLVVLRNKKERIIGVLAFLALIVLVVRPLTDFKDAGGHYLYFTSHRRFDSLLAGVALYLVTDGRPLALFQLLPRFALRVLAGAVLFALWVLPHASANGFMDTQGFVPLWGLSAVLVLLAAQEQDVIFGAFRPLASAMEFLGARSYGLYLAHYPLSWLLIEIEWRAKGGRWDQYHAAFDDRRWRALIYVVVLIAVVELLYRFVETPLRNLGRQLGARLRERQSIEELVAPRRGRIYALSVLALSLLALMAVIAWRQEHDLVSFTPVRPRASESLVVCVAGPREPEALHWGVTLGGQTWQNPIDEYLPAGSARSANAVETRFQSRGNGEWMVTLGPFNRGQRVEEVRFVIRFADGAWQKHEGGDFAVPIAP